MMLPVKYMKPTLKTQLNMGMAYDFYPQNWYVWIDRDSVVTSKGKSTFFLEQFLVVEEREHQVHIVKDNGSYEVLSGRFDRLQQPVDYGWVDKDQLILWNSALYSYETNFRIKVLPITEVSIIGPRVKQIIHGEKFMKYYNSPTALQPNEREAKVHDILYIYKRLGNRSLVGNIEGLFKSNQQLIIGWVDNDIIYLWENRITLEPSKAREAVQERKSHHVRASVFIDQADARAFIRNPSSVATALWKEDRYEKGYDNYWKRLPVLSSRDGVIETAVYIDLATVFEQFAIEEIDSLNLARLRLLLKMNYHFLIKGYTAHIIDNMNRPVYDYVLFLDSDELNDLIVTLNKLTCSRIDASGRRESLYNAFRQIFRVNYGLAIPEVQHLSLSKIMGLITGLESTSGLLKRYSLDDIQDPIAMDESGLESVLEYIISKRDLLQRIVPDDRYYYVSNLRPYYWLPQDVLP
jgi:hypothetical protein